ncbi:hypothetical protein AB4Y90_10005 [Chryseobacterium sp. 2TAF14]|uniref:hypothetical protein n=1 Tax=Chryseobacterium sp. 2TAF14 TaxID=3233007 RepID=UPI003F9229A6
MKTYFLTALVLGATLISCSKEKTEVNQNDTMSTETLPADTSMALPPSDTTALNAPMNADTAKTKSSDTTSVKR